MAHIRFLSSADALWGAENSLLQLAELLRDRGHRVTLVCTNLDLEAAWQDRSLGSTVRLRASAYRPVTLSRFVWAALQRGLGGSSDATVLFSIDLAALAPLLRLRRKRFGRVILDLHDVVSNPLVRVILRIAGWSADACVSVSSATAQLVGQRGAIVIRRPVMNPGFVHVRPANRPLRVAVVGRLDPIKRIEIVVRSMAGMTGVATLSIRGAGQYSTGGYEEQLKQLANRELGDNATFTGVLPHTRVFDDVDLLVVANPDEPMGRTVLEARSRGIPSVVPDRGGAAELVTDGVNGLLFASENEKALRDKILRLATNRDLYDQLADACARVARMTTDTNSQIARQYENAALGVRDEPDTAAPSHA